MREEIWSRRVERVRECVEAGLNAMETAAYLGITAKTVGVYVNRAGLNPPVGTRTLEEIRKCAERGLTRAETAAELGLSMSTVGNYGRKYAVPFRRAGLATHDPRSEAMASMYRAGKTLHEIGGVYGITRERVRQIINKYHGITAKDGGKTSRAIERRNRAAIKKEADCLRKYGCTVKQRNELIALGRKIMGKGASRYKTPIGAFLAQRRNARVRGIAWEITLWEWWGVWQKSEKWEERGRGQGYMMCRFGDTGPYAVGNVYIATGVHNGSVQPNNPYRCEHPDHGKIVVKIRQRRNGAARKSGDMHRVHRGLPTGVTRGKSRFQAQASINGVNKYLGSFDTPEEARAAYVAATAAINVSEAA